MKDQRYEPDRAGQRTGRERRQHEPAGDSQRIELFSVIFPMNHAGVDRALVDSAAVGVGDDATQNHREDRRQRYQTNQGEREAI